MVSLPPETLSSTPSFRKEKRRQFVVNWVFFICILSLLEGPLRKWLLPQFSTPLIVLRDPFVILLYIYAAQAGLIMRRGFAAIWLGFAGLTVIFGLIQYIVQGYGILVWVLGIRTYWLYMPLAFVVAKAFKIRDVQIFCQSMLYISVPYAMLMVMQYGFPPSSFVNLGIGLDQDAAVDISDGLLRPFGLFTYTAPNVIFATVMFSVVLIALLSGRQFCPPRPVFWCSIVAVAIMTVLTGSRAIIFFTGVILVVTLFGSILGGRSWNMHAKSIKIVGFVLLSALLLILIFPDMLSAMLTRLDNASSFEGSIWNRVAYSTGISGYTVSDASVLGFGIGAGAPGIAPILKLPALIYGESDWPRHINELGLILGPILIILRLWLAASLAALAYKSVKFGYPAALPLAGYAIVQVAVGQITNSPLNGFPAWLAVGLIIAISHTASQARNS